MTLDHQVVAEVVANIVEHAFALDADRRGRMLSVALTLSPDQVEAVLSDNGVPAAICHTSSRCALAVPADLANAQWVFSSAPRGPGAVIEDTFAAAGLGKPCAALDNVLA